MTDPDLIEGTIEEFIKKTLAAYETIEVEDKPTFLHLIAYDPRVPTHLLTPPSEFPCGAKPSLLTEELKFVISNPTVAGVLMLMDGWTYPADVCRMLYHLSDEDRTQWLADNPPPSARPDRKHVGQAMVVMRNGEKWMGVKTEDIENTMISSGDQVGGHEIDVLLELFHAG